MIDDPAHHFAVIAQADAGDRLVPIRIVPPGLQVVNRLSSVMASVGGGSEPASERAGVPAWQGATVVRLTGFALMAEVQTKVRRRERGYDEAEDDER